jgi:CO/xanthine dehydrogenase Mo-binding subunit
MKKRGIGMAVYNLPTGLNGSGDPSQAVIQLNLDGTLSLMVGAVDLGQGSNTILKQIAAEELDIPPESISIENENPQFAQLCVGTFASRVSLIDANAVLATCKEFKDRAKQIVSEIIEVPADELQFIEGKIQAKKDPEKSMTLADLGGATYFGAQNLVVSGAWSPGPKTDPNPEDGTMRDCCAISWTASVVELEVDTETGEVNLLKVVHANDIGKVANPKMAEAQVIGSMAMGIGFTLMENLDPYWPSKEFPTDSYGDYLISTAADMPMENRVAFVDEIPNPRNPAGTKGFSGELGASPAAIMNAIHDATGVWITEYPATPERILRALEDAEEK